MTSAAFAVAADGRREPVRLAQELNRGGAAGRIVGLADDPQRVVKIYHDASTAELARQRLRAMLARPPSLAPVRLNGVDYVQLAWPDALIEDAAGRLLGFRMPRVPLGLALPLECLLYPAQRRAEGLAEDYGLRVFAAANLASILAELHRVGHHIIDLKPLNLYVYRETMFIAVIDCDGFSVASRQQRFPAAHFSDEYRCPQSAGRGPQELGEEQDLFALAVIVFQLLNDGIHPFDGQPAPGACVPSRLQEKINAGLYPYGMRSGARLRPHALSLYPRLEDATQKLLDRALATPERPSATEWRDHLRGLIEGSLLVRCSANRDHAHFSKGCGLCAKEEVIQAAAAASRPAAIRPQPRRTPSPGAFVPTRLRRRSAGAARAAAPTSGRWASPPPFGPAAAVTTSSTGAAEALVQAMVTALKAGIVGGVFGVVLALAGLPLPAGPLALVLAIVLVLTIGIWIGHGRCGGLRGLTAGLVAIVPTAVVFPEMYEAAAWLPAPLALGIAAGLTALFPGFTFRYLRARSRGGRHRWSYAARRGAAGVAGMVLLGVCQVAAVAWLDLPQAGPRPERPPLTHAVLGAVDQARQSIAEVVDRVRSGTPPQSTSRQ